MSPTPTRTLRAQQFAELAGVTVRALHHYDRLGLLRPRRSASGYRLYQERDLERLEQIVALKFLGLPLKRIKTLLSSHSLDLSSALSMQRQVLAEKRRLMDRAILAIHDAERVFAKGQRPSAAILKNIIEVIEMQNSSEWTSKYYSKEAKEKIEARKHLWSPEMQKQVSKDWTELIRDVDTALSENPSLDSGSETAQALAARWLKLIEGFTGGDPQITEGLKKLYNDQLNWPAEARAQMAPFENPKVWQFIHKAIALRK